MHNPTVSPKTIVCVPCWRDTDNIVDRLVRDVLVAPRFFIRHGDDLILHRLVTRDDHTIHAACGDLFTPQALVERYTGQP